MFISGFLDFSLVFFTTLRLLEVVIQWLKEKLSMKSSNAGRETLLSDSLQLWNPTQQKNFFGYLNKASRY